MTHCSSFRPRSALSASVRLSPWAALFPWGAHCAPAFPSSPRGAPSVRAFFRPRAALPALVLVLACVLALAPLTPARGQAAKASAAVSKTAQPKSTAEDIEDIDLKKLVPRTRMEDGKRAIFPPRSVRFTAKLAQMPSPQKSEYLQKAFGLMGVANPPAVSKRIAVDYGGDKPLAAYVEEKAAADIAKSARAGGQYTFYAIYLYNNRFGPALVVTAFSR
ncbi:MAG: hypothetical protein LBO79_06605 [Zoogloeaceae bacterium]|jgi:hypothetical protein|nr:hypothetical protein [Zoogloeaceae bacterium]